MKTQTKNSLMLMLCAFIWGTAFVAQSAGSGMGAYSFLAGRSWLAVLVLLPTMAAFDALRKKQGAAYGWPKERAERKTLLMAGLVCGTLLFAASAAQQIGITINPSTAKAGFLTAMYVVLVPVFGLFLGRKGSVQLWASMVIAVVGLYLLRRRRDQRLDPVLLRGAVQLPDHVHRPLFAAGGRREAEPLAVYRSRSGEHGGGASL